MAAIGDYMKATQDRLWAIFEGDTGTGGWATLVRAGNRIKRTGTNPYPQKTAKAPADCGEADLMVSRGTMAGFTGEAAKTFGGVTTAPPCAFTTANQITYQLTVTWPDLRSNNATALLARVEYLLFNAGARLSLDGSPLDGAAMWGPITFSHVEQTTGEAAGSLRLIQKIQIPVFYRLQKSQILG